MPWDSHEVTGTTQAAGLLAVPSPWLSAAGLTHRWIKSDFQMLGLADMMASSPLVFYINTS